jgi:hypothetical protein
MIARNSSAYYDPFDLRKEPRPFTKVKPKTKIRRIDRPTADLREVQDRIYYRLLRDLKVPRYLCGGVKGRSVMMNVRLHNGAPVIVTLDIKAWFPSITPQHVYRALRKVLNCSTRVAKLLTALTTFDGHLPQGASTSSAIANLVLFSIDRPLRTRSARMGVQYSSFVDDLPLSGSNARRLIPVAIATLKRAGFAISRSKLLVMGSGARKVVNGIVVGKTPSMSKQHRLRIRSALHHLRLGDVPEADRDKYIASLKGRIVHLASVNPAQAMPFQAELMRILN